MIEPLCAFCLKEKRLTPATVADHVFPHRGDYNKFMTGRLQSLCVECHNIKKQKIEQLLFKKQRPPVDLKSYCSALKRKRLGYDTAVGVDGWPTDPNHPSNRVPPRGAGVVHQ